MIKRGALRAEKVLYKDGEGCTIWQPFNDEDEDIGLCFDFSASDLDDFIALLKQLRYEPAKVLEEEPEEEPKKEPFAFVRYWLHSVGWWLLSK